MSRGQPVIRAHSEPAGAKKNNPEDNNNNPEELVHHSRSQKEGETGSSILSTSLQQVENTILEEERDSNDGSIQTVPNGRRSNFIKSVPKSKKKNTFGVKCGRRSLYDIVV